MLVVLSQQVLSTSDKSTYCSVILEIWKYSINYSKSSRRTEFANISMPVDQSWLTLP